jgi:Holliday junction resolvase RusA-like endonuclease
MSTSVRTQMATGSPDYVLIINQPLFSKARPRLTRSGHAYMPQTYKDAQAEMKRQMAEQWGTRSMLSGPVRLEVWVKGEGRGDLDNIVGAMMDSGHNILWDDDRVSVIPSLSVHWEKACKKDSQWIIHITEMTP